VAEAPQELTSIGPNNLVTASASSVQGNETSGVSLPSGNPQYVFVSYNSQPSVARPDGTFSRCGWAYSANAGAAWTSKEDWSGNVLPGWGPIGGGYSYHHCRGDTYSAAIALQSPTGGGSTDRRVAMVAIADNWNGGGDRNFDVGMWTSSDGGVTFPNVTRVSDGPQTGSAGVPDTGSDGPKIAADPTNQAVYVYWWNGYSSTQKYNWLRKYTIGLAGQIAPAGAAINISAMLANPLYITHPGITIKPAAAVGQQPTIYLAYPSFNPGYIDCSDATGNPPLNAAKANVTWHLSYSSNGGASWTNVVVDNDPAWPICLSKTSRGHNMPYISIAYDKTNDAVMLSYSRHIDDQGGSYVGTRVVTRRFVAGAMNGYWVPICNPVLCGAVGCLMNGAPRVGETYCHQFGQSVAVRSGPGDYRFASVFHDTRDSNSVGFPHPAVGDSVTVNRLASDVWGYAGRTGLPVQGWATMSRITPLASNVPWLETSTTGHTWWGDYEAATINLGSKFYAAWGDNRDGTTSTKLRGAYFNE
jgi:hypothetical protein